MDQKVNNRSKGNRSGIFIGAISIIAVVIAFVAFDGYPPSDDQTSGAIGTADRS